MTDHSPTDLPEWMRDDPEAMGRIRVQTAGSIARVFDVPPWMLGLEPRPPRTRAQRLRVKVGRALRWHSTREHPLGRTWRWWVSFDPGSLMVGVIIRTDSVSVHLGPVILCADAYRV